MNPPSLRPHTQPTRIHAANSCNPRTASDWHKDGCIFSNPTATTVAGLGQHNRVVQTTSCEVSCPVDGADFAVFSQTGESAGRTCLRVSVWLDTQDVRVHTCGWLDNRALSMRSLYQESLVTTTTYRRPRIHTQD